MFELCVMHENFSLKEKCCMKVGGTAKYACFPETEEQLISVLAYCDENKIEYTVIGNASNTIFACERYEGCVIFTTALTGISVEGRRITAYAGTQMGALSRFALEHSLSGLEFAYGIPGTVGGGVYMNAGAYGGQMSDVFESAVCIDKNGKKKVLSAEDMQLSYRHSAIMDDGSVLVSASFMLRDGKYDEIKNIMDTNMAARRAKQALEYPSCGSTFKRPEGHFAGRLIEDCGLKGFTVGGAQVSEKHAGFIINRGNATVQDVLACIEEVRQRVFAQTGVMLEPEIRIIR